MADHKARFIFRLEGGRLLAEVTDAGKRWSPLKQGTELRLLPGPPDCQNFDASVIQISDVTRYAQFLRGILSEIAVAHTLDPPGDKVALCCSGFAHEIFQIVSKRGNFFPAAVGARLERRAPTALDSFLAMPSRVNFGTASRIQVDMNLRKLFSKNRPSFRVARYCALSGLTLFALPVLAQDVPQGPMAPPPPEHRVVRIGTTSEPEAPPSTPESEIIKRLSQKEDAFLLARLQYSYKKTVRIQEFGPDGQPDGEFTLVTQPARDAEGKLVERIAEHPKSTLKHLFLRSEDMEGLMRIPAFPLTTSQLAKYDLKYVGKEQVDEINCYLFQVKPKAVERVKAYFDGVVWVDDKYLEVVKTYGKWITELGDVQSIKDLPFALFETYRENVDGKYWFPNYSRSDDTLTLKGNEVPMRIIIKWTDFKPMATATTAPTTAPELAPTKP